MAGNSRRANHRTFKNAFQIQRINCDALRDGLGWRTTISKRLRGVSLDVERLRLPGHIAYLDLVAILITARFQHRLYLLPRLIRVS